jgi:mannosyltransferase OCH1-like enzyme
MRLVIGKRAKTMKRMSGRNILKVFVYVFVTGIVFTQSVKAYVKYLPSNAVDFHTSMHRNPFHDSDFARSNASWQFAERLFKDAVVDNLAYSDQTRIPLYLHHIWLGSPLPDYAKRFRQTWIDLCADWTFILWADFPSLDYGDVILYSFSELEEYLAQENRSRFIVMDMRAVRLHNHVALHERAKNYGVKSDLIRYEALYHVGGLYVDTDFECLKPFDELHYALDFYIGIAYDYPHCFSLLNGLMSSAPHHPLLKEVIEQLHDKPSIDNNSLMYTGPHFLTEVFLDVVPHIKSRVVAFPLTYFYPMPNETAFGKDHWIEPESYAVHHWKKSWQ